MLRPAYNAKVSETCFWNSNTKQLGDLFQKQKIKGSLWNLCEVYAGLYMSLGSARHVSYKFSYSYREMDVLQLIKIKSDRILSGHNE